MQDEAALPYKVTMWFIVNQTYCQRKPFKEVMGLLKRGKAGVREREREWGASEGPLKDCHPASKHPSTASNDSYRGRGGGEWQTGTWGQTPPWLNTLWAKFSKKMERKTTDKVLGGGGCVLLIHHSISNSLPQAARNKIHLKEKKKSHAICIKETCFTCKSTST